MPPIFQKGQITPWDSISTLIKQSLISDLPARREARKGSITDGVYNRYEYDAERRAALELWADAVYAITGRGPAEIDGYHARLARLKGGEKILLG